METKTEKALPNIVPLAGAVCAQYVRRGQALCGPYWYRFWREGGRLRKAYVRPDELESVRDRCRACQAQRAQALAQRRRAEDAMRELRKLLRGLDV